MLLSITAPGVGSKGDGDSGEVRSALPRTDARRRGLLKNSDVRAGAALLGFILAGVVLCGITCTVAPRYMYMYGQGGRAAGHGGDTPLEI